MTANINADGYTVLRETKPIIEWYAELQTAAGVAACARHALVSYRTSDAGVTPMTFSLPVTGADVSLPCQIEQVRLYAASSGGDPLSDADTVDPLLLALEGDEGSVTLTITFPEVT